MAKKPDYSKLKPHEIIAHRDVLLAEKRKHEEEARALGVEAAELKSLAADAQLEIQREENRVASYSAVEAYKRVQGAEQRFDELLKVQAEAMSQLVKARDEYAAMAKRLEDAIAHITGGGGVAEKDKKPSRARTSKSKARTKS